MQRELLHQSTFIQIEYDSRHFVYVDWRGYVTVPQVKEGCEQMYRAMMLKQCFSLINDNRLLLGTWTQSVRWIAREFLPRLTKEGLLRVAFIYSREASARYSVDKLLEENDEYLAQTFENYDCAERWLLETSSVPEFMPVVADSVLRFRDKTKHYVLPTSEINYLVANGKSVLINTKNDTLVARTTLDALNTQLRNTVIMRVHRSYMLNIDKVSHITYHAGGSYLAFFKGQEKLSIPVGRTFAAALKKRLGV